MSFSDAAVVKNPPANSGEARDVGTADFKIKSMLASWPRKSFTSVQFSRSVVANSLRLHELQQARPPCPSPTTGVYPNSCPLSRWCHLTFSSSVVPFSSCLQSFATSGSFQMIQLFTSGGQNIGVSASTSILPMNTQDWFPLGWIGWISLQSKGLLRVFSNTTHSSKASILQPSAIFIVQLSHPHITTEKTIALTRWTFVGKVMALLFHMLSRLIITLLPRSKHLFISWLQSPSAMILEPQKIKCDTVSTVSPSISHEDQMPWSSFSECWALSQLFHSPLSLSSRSFLVPLHFLP